MLATGWRSSRIQIDRPWVRDDEVVALDDEIVNRDGRHVEPQRLHVSPSSVENITPRSVPR